MGLVVSGQEKEVQAMTRRERLEKRLERRQEWSEKAELRSSAAFERSNRAVAGIEPGQPILVGHHSERRHRRDLDRSWAALGKSVEEQKLAKHHEQKARGLAIQLERTIFSDDEDAIEKLEAKAADCDAAAERCNAINKAWRKGGRDAVAAEFGEALAKTAEELCSRFSWLERKGPMDATSDRAEARRCRERIKVLQARQIRADEAEAAGGVRLVERQGWAVVTFVEKPERIVLLALRSAGYHWGNGSWHGAADRLPPEVRQLVDEQAQAGSESEAAE